MEHTSIDIANIFSNVFALGENILYTFLVLV